MMNGSPDIGQLWGIVTVLVVSVVNGFFAIKAAKSSHRSELHSREVQSKVGNGFAQDVQDKLDSIQSLANAASREALEAKRLAGTTNDQIRRTRSAVERLRGSFEQHIVEHNWDRRRTHNEYTTTRQDHS